MSRLRHSDDVTENPQIVMSVATCLDVTVTCDGKSANCQREKKTVWSKSHLPALWVTLHVST